VEVGSGKFLTNVVLSFLRLLLLVFIKTTTVMESFKRYFFPGFGELTHQKSNQEMLFPGCKSCLIIRVFFCLDTTTSSAQAQKKQKVPVCLKAIRQEDSIKPFGVKLGNDRFTKSKKPGFQTTSAFWYR
jgi:hypothetical protein